MFTNELTEIFTKHREVNIIYVRALQNIAHTFPLPDTEIMMQLKYLQSYVGRNMTRYRIIEYKHLVCLLQQELVGATDVHYWIAAKPIPQMWHT